MLNTIVKNKIDRSKLNIDSYLNVVPGSQLGRKQQNPQGSMPSRGGFPSQSQPNAGSQMVKTGKTIKNEIQLKAVIFMGKKYENGELMMRFSKQQAILSVFYEEGLEKIRVDIKRDDIKGKRIEYDQEKGVISISVRSGTIKKEDIKASVKSSGWIRDRIIKEETLTTVCKDKDHIRYLKESAFAQGLSDVETQAVYIETPRQVEQPEQQEMEDDHNSIRFQVPTPQQLAETQKLRRNIKQMKEDDKVTVLMDVYKIKKQYQDPSGITKKLKCPIQNCQKNYRETQQLKAHLKQKHPQLAKHGIQFTEYDASFDYSQKALDVALYLGKMFPNEMKKIIKIMKTKPLE